MKMTPKRSLQISGKVKVNDVGQTLQHQEVKSESDGKHEAWTARHDGERKRIISEILVWFLSITMHQILARRATSHHNAGYPTHEKLHSHLISVKSKKKKKLFQTAVVKTSLNADVISTLSGCEVHCFRFISDSWCHSAVRIHLIPKKIVSCANFWLCFC